ncbi:protein TONSOKU-like [Rutidosis leptorrhynchoides]|uniref:protein TONSOKU-like n=1 Tax=Rutidosis leptorrhynchoides TaxID=125765 RepID=UPI003A991DBF
MTKKSDEGQLSAAKRAYRNASSEGNHQEEARWANQIGNILKNRGEYVEALRWLRTDYEVSVKYLPEKHLLPTCQSLGEVHLRLCHFQDALNYQKMHLELAKDANDLIEQQRANTQLGRTYHELFLKSEDDLTSLRNAKKYFTSAMKLARTIKKSNKQTFLKEYIDSYNNIGMLEMDLDNPEEAKSTLEEGLRICDEEEVDENDDGRTRLHHNLGRVYTELRKWDEAKDHVEKDIVICKNIGHVQGEAKGYINLGELHYQLQKYEEASHCYEKAMKLAKSMDDEDDLVKQIDQNIKTVNKAIKVMEELNKEKQNLKKLIRNMAVCKGTSRERKCLLQQNASLDRLIDQTSSISAWTKHCEFAKKKKKVSSELCDKEKLGDSYLFIGESYHKLRNFDKANKWYSKSWDTYKSIGNLEGQALAKINLGDVLDCVGKWADALEAFTEGYRIACEANLPNAQLSALNNMHYSQMMRFDNDEEARRLNSEIQKLKQLIDSESGPSNIPKDCCSETDTDGDDVSPMKTDSPKSNIIKSNGNDELADDDPPLLSPHSNDYPSKSTGSKKSTSPRRCGQKVGRKRGRLVLSDDEDDDVDQVRSLQGNVDDFQQEHVATSNELKSRDNISSHVDEYPDISPVATRSAISATTTPVHMEESTSSHKSRSSKQATRTPQVIRFSMANEAGLSENICLKTDHSFGTCDDESCKHIIFKVEDDFVHIEPSTCKFGDKHSMEYIKVEVACLYFLKLCKENRSTGLLPVIQHLKCGGEVLESSDVLDTPKDFMCGKCWVEVSIHRWVAKRLIKQYIDCCNDLSESPNHLLLKKLYKLEVSEDVIDVSECELEDQSATPLVNALRLHTAIAALNLSHNLLGNETLEKLKQVFVSSSPTYGGLVLDLHHNRFGPSALAQISECPVILSRLEVLNISGNRLTDGCANYLSIILQKCKGLYSLNIERCSITYRTIQKVTESLNSESLLSELFIGYNSPITEKAIVNLVDKLASLNSFCQLNMNGIKLTKNAVDSLCKLVGTSCLSGLMIGETSIGTERAIQLMDSWNGEVFKLDLSSCLLTSNNIIKLSSNASLISGIIELNLGGNQLMQEGGIALASLLKETHCLKFLNLSKCQLSLVGVLSILQALSDNTSIEELNLSENALQDEYHTLVVAKPDQDINQDVCELVVADSEDDADGSCTSSFENNLIKSKSTFIQQLSCAISAAKHLRLLDVSNNGICEQVGETLYKAWSMDSRGGLTLKHIEKTTVHLSVDGYQCCNIKPCCKKFCSEYL